MKYIIFSILFLGCQKEIYKPVSESYTYKVVCKTMMPETHGYIIEGGSGDAPILGGFTIPRLCDTTIPNNWHLINGAWLLGTTTIQVDSLINIDSFWHQSLKVQQLPMPFPFVHAPYQPLDISLIFKQ